MGTKYSTVSISGYNATPPADNGVQTAANKVQWSTLKTKLTDPHNAAITAINSNLVAALNVGPTAKTASYTTVAADYGTILEVTNSVTITLLSAATGGAGYHVTVKNAGSGDVLVASADNIDGAANYNIVPNESSVFIVDSGGTTYLKISTATATSGWTKLLTTQTASSSASLDFTSLDTSYRVHKFVLDGIRPATVDDKLIMQMYAGGTILTTAVYQWHASMSSQASGAYIGDSSDATDNTHWALSEANMQSDSGQLGWTGEVTVINPGLTTTGYNAHWQGSYLDTVDLDELRQVAGAGRITTGGGSAQNGMRFKFSTGLISSGNITFYGLN